MPERYSPLEAAALFAEDAWFKAKESTGGNDGEGCLEVNKSEVKTKGVVGVRHSRQPAAATLVFKLAQWGDFLVRTRRGDFDLPDLAGVSMSRLLVPYSPQEAATWFEEAKWDRSPGSGDAADGESCVEVNLGQVREGIVGLRDSQQPGAATLVYDLEEWRCFLVGAGKGEFDVPELAAAAA